MAIVINTEPGNQVSLSDEILFTVFEATKTADEVTYPDYRYICDVYVDDVFAARLKSRPDPLYKRGVFDVSSVIRNYATYGLKANYSNASETYTAKVSYKVKFGEEYDDTTYTNLLVDGSARYAFKSYAIRPFSATNVLNISSQFCTNAPATIYSYKDIKWQFIPFFDNISGVSDITLRFYDSAAVQVGSSVTISTAGYVADTYFQANVGFQKVAAALTTNQKNSVSYAIVSSYDNEAASDFFLTIKYICDKYTPVVIAWLNQYGAYDSYAFGFVSKKNLEISRKEFQQLHYRMDASGVMSYSADGVFYGGRRGYNTETKVSLKLTSHLLADNEYSWLREIFNSPDVYMYDDTLSLFVPVTVQDNQYEVRTYLNSRLKPLEFTVNIDSYNSQYL